MDPANVKSHQKEAVDWIFRRETLNSPVSRSLWELENSKKDFKWLVEPCYYLASNATELVLMVFRTTVTST